MLWGFPGSAGVKNPPANAGEARDSGSILGLGRYPGVGNGNPLQNSCLGNPMGREAWQATDQGVAELGMTEHTQVLFGYGSASGGLRSSTISKWASLRK